jgi:hypothetical protein
MSLAGRAAAAPAAHLQGNAGLLVWAGRIFGRAATGRNQTRYDPYREK